MKRKKITFKKIKSVKNLTNASQIPPSSLFYQTIRLEFIKQPTELIEQIIASTVIHLQRYLKKKKNN